MNNSIKNRRRAKLQPVFIIAGTFLILIVFGTFLLSLPIAHKSATAFPFVKSLFTATSAVCVTGLVVADTFAEFSIFGQIVLIFLIQCGGLGLMTIATIMLVAVGKKITLRERLILQQQYGQNDLSGLVKMVIHICKYTFSIELVGIVLLAFDFIPRFGFSSGLWKAVFHSISAFCNAGFDIFGTGSLTTFSSNPFVLITVMLLIILGGLGFAVIANMLETFNSNKKLNLFSKTVLKITGTLIIFGTIFFAVFEWNNPLTIGNMSVFDKIINALFQSVTPRTAGFNSIDQGSLTPISVILTNFLMFIGASSGGTGGGIKITTAFLLVLMFVSGMKSDNSLIFKEKQIPARTAFRAFAIMIFTLFIVFAVSAAILAFEISQGHSILYSDILFESFSALGTVGLSRGITSSLCYGSLITLSIGMFVGRLGSLSISLLIILSNKTRNIKYTEYNFTIG